MRWDGWGFPNLLYADLPVNNFLRLATFISIKIQPVVLIKKATSKIPKNPHNPTVFSGLKVGKE